MPNWTGNAITLRGNKESRQTFKLRVRGKNGAFDFNRIIQMPKNSKQFLASGKIGTEEERKFGKNNWYEWSNEHWGTKWNAWEVAVDEHDDTLTYLFYTAWDCPRPLIEPIVKLAQELDLSIVWETEHEDSGYEAIYDSDTKELEAA